MQKIEAVVFDCDGVMFESRAANMAYYNRILAEFAYSPVPDDDSALQHFCHTASSPQVLERLLRTEHLAPALAFSRKLDYRQFIPHMTPQAYLGELLEELHGRYPLAVATNRGRSIEPILEHFQLTGYFATVVTSHDVAAPKPAPDMLLLAAEKLAVAPARCLYIGDSELDRAAAEAAGMEFAGYGPAVSTQRSLSDHRELLSLLENESEGTGEDRFSGSI